MLVHQTYFENNRADFGTAIHSTGESAASVVDTGVFNNNGNDGISYNDRYVIRASGGAEFVIVHSTFADNHATESVFGISNLLNSKLTLTKSIVHDSSSGDTLNGNPGTTVFDCIFAYDINSISGTQLFFGDPEFVDREGGDYHLNASISPAIDLCVSNDVRNDIDYERRGWDDPTVQNEGNNVNATYDAGADESYGNDVLFSNSFDS